MSNDSETVQMVHDAFVNAVDAISQERPVTNGEALTAAMVFIVASASASAVGFHPGFRDEAIELLDTLLEQIQPADRSN